MLHIVNKSPYEKDSLELCLAYAQQASDVLLIEDGVYACLADARWSQRVSAAIGRVELYALKPDLQLRGIGPERCLAGVNLIEYHDFVALVAANDRVQSWL